MRTKGANDAEWALARLAANQHGVVSLAQLRAIGISAEAARHRARAGRFHRVHRSVYAIGHEHLSDEGRWMAAVLVSGDGAVVSHRSAAALWRLLARHDGPVDITIPTSGGKKRRAGIRLHRSTSLTQRETTRRSGIPVTSPARTLTDLRSCVSRGDLNRARRKAEFLGYRIEAADQAPVDHTRSELERRFLALCNRRRLPSPEVNVSVAGYTVDFLWRWARLIAETDGHRFHTGRTTIEHDRRREAHLTAAGYEVLRFTWTQVVERPDEVTTTLRARLTPTLTLPQPVSETP